MQSAPANIAHCQKKTENHIKLDPINATLVNLGFKPIKIDRDSAMPTWIIWLDDSAIKDIIIKRFVRPTLACHGLYQHCLPACTSKTGEWLNDSDAQAMGN